MSDLLLAQTAASADANAGLALVEDNSRLLIADWRGSCTMLYGHLGGHDALPLEWKTTST